MMPDAHYENVIAWSQLDKSLQFPYKRPLGADPFGSEDAQCVAARGAAVEFLFNRFPLVDQDRSSTR